MSASTAYNKRRTASQRNLRGIAKRVLKWHLPVGSVSRPLFSALYRLHVLGREAIAWTLRFAWYEPLFRSQCSRIGSQFEMEQLPYLVGRGEIQLGDGVRFSGKPSFLFSSRHSDSPALRIGDGCFLGHNTAITVARSVTLGHNCLIAGGVRITDFDGHAIDPEERRNGHPGDTDQVRPTSLGNDVWVGHNAMILKGVHVGDRAIVGARSVVTRDVPPDSVVAGNPARIVRSPEAT